MSRLFCVILILLAMSASADVPPMINYQGKLMQPSGAPVPDGTYAMRFAIYDDPVLTDGHERWSEPNPSVQVKGGLFAVMLGSVNNLPSDIFDGADRFFAVKVGTDPEMTPRQKIASVGFAIKAGAADIAATVPDGAITAAKLAPGVAIPPGTILMWSGAVNQIPQGWALCDGTNGTPNLGSKFIVGVGGADNYAVGDKGGLERVTLTAAQMPSHKHAIDSSEGIWYYGSGWFNISSGGYDGNWGHNVTNPQTLYAGGDQPHENRPPYYALCFIMKLGY